MDAELEKKWDTLTPWQQYKAMRDDPTACGGFSHYIMAEHVALHRAVYILKQLEAGETMLYTDLLKRSVEYANSFPGIGAKYREAGPRIEALADYGVIVFDGDPSEPPTTVRLTAKGFLAQPHEWFDEKTKEEEEYDFDADSFSAKWEKQS